MTTGFGTAAITVSRGHSSIGFRNADKSYHDQLDALVEQLLDLHRQLAPAKTPAERTRLQRQIAATDQRIDRLVYDLYGLTPEEIKIVEGENPRTS